jgi:hypothetical protein
VLKWKLFLSTLPIVAAVVAAKVAFEHLLGLKGFVEFSDVSAVLTAGAFLIGFMLAGTMSDYKESEKLPAELATALEAVEESLALGAQRAGLDAAVYRASAFELTEAVLAWIRRTSEVSRVHDVLAGLGQRAQELDHAGGGPYVMRAIGEGHNVRKTVTRIEVISKTGFLATGYAILEFMVTAIIALLIVSEFRNAVAEYTLITFISLVYVYLLRLIRDVDDPFEYGMDGARGAAEVDLFPLTSYRERAQERLAAPALRPVMADVHVLRK